MKRSISTPTGGAGEGAPTVPPSPRMGGAVQANTQSEWIRGDEELLVRECLAGKRWAEREVWYRYSSMVYGLLRRALGPQHDHEDLMQEVFLRVFRRLHSIEKYSALRSFVYSVAFRVVSERIRHFRVLARVRAQLLHIPRVTCDLGADFEMREVLLRVQRVLDGMRDKYRAVFVLRYVEGMDLYEIAQGLDISLATVKRYLAKATTSIARAVERDSDLAASLAWLAPSERRGGTG